MVLKVCIKKIKIVLAKMEKVLYTIQSVQLIFLDSSVGRANGC